MLRSICVALALFAGALSAQVSTNITTNISSSYGERTPLGVMEQGGWSVIEWTGEEFTVGIHNNETVVAKIDLSSASPQLLYLGTIEDSFDGGGETHITTKWTCDRGLQHEVTTKITTRYADSDMRKHDEKLNKALLRYPPAKPKPVEETENGGGQNPKAPDPSASPPADGGDGGMVNLPGGGSLLMAPGGVGGLVNLPGGGGAK